MPDEVNKLRNQFKFSGIKLLQLAFDLKEEEIMPLGNYHLPHNLLPRDVIYTGTHDSDTTKSWFERVKKIEERQKFVCEYLNTKLEEMPWSLVQVAFQSVARLAIIPMQDVLSLEGNTRMNIPGPSQHNNWEPLKIPFQWFDTVVEEISLGRTQVKFEELGRN